MMSSVTITVREGNAEQGYSKRTFRIKSTTKFGKVVDAYLGDRVGRKVGGAIRNACHLYVEETDLVQERKIDDNETPESLGITTDDFVCNIRIRIWK